MPPSRAEEAELVTRHRRLVFHFAKRYARRRPEERDDLVAVGLEALLVAIRRFDPDRGPFGSYASAYVCGAMLRHLRDRRSVVRRGAWDVSLDAPIGADEDGATRVEAVADDAPTPDEIVADEERLELVRRTVEELPAYDRALLDGLARGELVGDAWRRERALELLRKRLHAAPPKSPALGL